VGTSDSRASRLRRAPLEEAASACTVATTA
jgi:hypothetical protein